MEWMNYETSKSSAINGKYNTKSSCIGAFEEEKNKLGFVYKVICLLEFPWTTSSRQDLLSYIEVFGGTLGVNWLTVSFCFAIFVFYRLSKEQPLLSRVAFCVHPFLQGKEEILVSTTQIWGIRSTKFKEYNKIVTWVFVVEIWAWLMSSKEKSNFERNVV